MTDVEYQLQRSDIPYAERLVDDLDYDEFSETCLMPSLLAKVCILSFSLSFLFSCIFLHMVKLKCDAYVRVRLVLLPAVLLTLLVNLGQFMLLAPMSLLRSVLWDVTQMS